MASFTVLGSNSEEGLCGIWEEKGVGEGIWGFGLGWFGEEVERLRRVLKRQKRGGEGWSGLGYRREIEDSREKKSILLFGGFY